ncbi:MAG: crotonase/enoyl-CoA hydratase family protein [Actinobacteria bacterium]|nr:crotonase/enoyl-CoA hydratase family protein [Actinomycetota bacterium]
MAAAVLTEERDGVLLVTLNRPEARNAVDGALAEGVAAAVERLEAEDGLRVGVITGAGKAFCSGMDLKAFLRGETPHAGGRGFAGICERPPVKPMVAAVEGFAVAGGLEIALSCDLIVAGRGARLGIPETQRALIAGAGALLRLPRRIPHHVAMELALTGELIDAARGYELGLVNRLCDDGDALSAALELAATIAANGPLAVRVSKEIVDQLVELPEAEAWSRQQAFIDRIMESADAREGAAAFAEKRAPVWTGR